MEDALLQQAQQSAEALQQLQQLQQNLQQMELVLGAAMEDNQAYNLLTTTPELLADYVKDFFGPNGVVPTELPEDRLAAEVAANEARMPGRAQAQSQAQPQRQYQRPQVDIAAPGDRAQSGNPGDFWAIFDHVSRHDPANLWRVLAQAPAGALRSKALISDSAPA